MVLHKLFHFNCLLKYCQKNSFVCGFSFSTRTQLGNPGLDLEGGRKAGTFIRGTTLLVLSSGHTQGGGFARKWRRKQLDKRAAGQVAIQLDRLVHRTFYFKFTMLKQDVTGIPPDSWRYQLSVDCRSFRGYNRSRGILGITA